MPCAMLGVGSAKVNKAELVPASQTLQLGWDFRQQEGKPTQIITHYHQRDRDLGDFKAQDVVRKAQWGYLLPIG